MTIFEFSKTLPPPIAYRFFMAILKENDELVIEKLRTNYEFSNRCDVLGGSISWDCTQEGHKYWNNLYNKIYNQMHPR